MELKDYINHKKEIQHKPFITITDLTKKEQSTLTIEDNFKNYPKIRMYYIALEKFNRYGENTPLIGQTIGITSPFFLPEEMSIKDACKVISYLSEKVERENRLEPASEDSVAMVSNILEKYGFVKVGGHNHGHLHAVGEYEPHKIIPICAPKNSTDENIKNLYTIGGDFNLFKKSDLYHEYFNWFTENITEDEIINIYKKIKKEHLLPDDQSM